MDLAMSDPLRIVLAGSSGLIGSHITQLAKMHVNCTLTALSRAVAPADHWPSLIAKARPDVLISALGTTWKASGRSEDAFRAVDQHLVLACAKAAKDAGASYCISISSIGASAKASGFYLRVKGEVENQLAALDFRRLDLLRPGLLRGKRGGELRVSERAAIIASPLTDLLMIGSLRRYRSITAENVAKAALQLARESGRDCSEGKHIHEHDALIAAAARFGG